MSIIKALAAGIAVGVVLIEGLCQALTAFTPLPPMCPPGPDGTGALHILPLALIWLTGSVAAGTMAAGMTRRRPTGWITGAALCIPLALIVVLLDVTGGELAIVALPLFAGGAGAELAGRLIVYDRHTRSPDRGTAL